MKCPNCSKQYETIVSLSKHWSKTHKKTTESLYQELHGVGQKLCACGCGGATKFLDAGRGYSDFLRGHIARIKNNFQTDKAKENSLATRRKMLETGEWKPFTLNETGERWSKGLTKETDERIAKMAETIRGNTEEIERRSQRMKENRLNGTIPTLRGKEHSQWKGGISCLRDITYSLLYAKWKLPKLQEANFKCRFCNASGKMEVHHDEEKFATILNRLAQEMKWDVETWKTDPEWNTSPKYQELKNEIAEAVADYHIKNNVSGIVLCESCHEKEHAKYNL